MWEHNYNMLKWKAKYLWNVEISFTFKKNRLVHDFCMFIKVIISNTNDKKNSTKNYRFVKKKKNFFTKWRINTLLIVQIFQECLLHFRRINLIHEMT